MYLHHNLWVLLMPVQKFSVGLLATVCCRFEDLGKAGSDAIKVAAAKTRVLCNVLQVPGTGAGLE